MPDEPMATYCGIVHAWQCDSMGHMNAGFYGRIFDDANAVAIRQLGFILREGVAAGIGWVEARLEIDFRHELLVDTVVAVKTRLRRVGAKSITLEHALHDETNGRVASNARSVTVCFDLRSACVAGDSGRSQGARREARPAFVTCDKRSISFCMTGWISRGCARFPDSRSTRSRPSVLHSIPVSALQPSGLRHTAVVSMSKSRRSQDGNVTLPRCAHEAARAYRESGMLASAQDYELGGMQLPTVVQMAGHAFFAKAGISLGGAYLLTLANANLLMKHGTLKSKADIRP